MEKLVLALVTTAKRLRPYFQAHTIEIPTKHPMKQILHKLETSGRLVKLAIELSEFDIRYKPRTTIKGQILADFIMEFTSAEPTETAQLASAQLATDRGRLRSKRRKDDSLSQKGTRVAQKIRTCPYQTHPKGGELMGRRPS